MIAARVQSVGLALGACLLVLTAGAARGRAEPAGSTALVVAGARDAVRVPVSLRAGPTVALVGGGHFGTVSVQVAYAVPVGRRWLQVAPFVAAGVYLGDSTSPRYATGVTTSLGWKHRLVVSGAAGRLTTESLRLHGTTVDRQPLYGMAAGLGYEYLSPKGGLFRALPQLEFTPGTRLGADRWAPDFHLTLAVGQRF